MWGVYIPSWFSRAVTSDGKSREHKAETQLEKGNYLCGLDVAPGCGNERGGEQHKEENSVGGEIKDCEVGSTFDMLIRWTACCVWLKLRCSLLHNVKSFAVIFCLLVCLQLGGPAVYESAEGIESMVSSKCIILKSLLAACRSLVAAFAMPCPTCL